MAFSSENNDIPVTGLFLYDRDCGFCQRSVAFARTQLRTQTIFVAWQEFDLTVAEVASSQSDESAWLLYLDGRRYSGSEAVVESLRNGRALSRPFAALMARWPLRPAEGLT